MGLAHAATGQPNGATARARFKLVKDTRDATGQMSEIAGQKRMSRLEKEFRHASGRISVAALRLIFRFGSEVQEGRGARSKFVSVPLMRIS